MEITKECFEYYQKRSSPTDHKITDTDKYLFFTEWINFESEQYSVRMLSNWSEYLKSVAGVGTFGNPTSQRTFYLRII